MNPDLKKKMTSEDADFCLEVLQTFLENPEQFGDLPEKQRIALLTAAGQLSRPSREEQLRRSRQIQKGLRKKVVTEERSARAATGIRAARTAAVFSAPEKLTLSDASAPRLPELKSPRNCYVCKAEYTQLHFFYDAMCPACA